LSTSAVRDKVSARKPPIQPTPITPTSTVFTGHLPSCGGRIKIMMRRDVQCCAPSGQQASFSRRASSPERCKTLPREARSPGRTCKERGGASVSLFATPVSPKPRNKAGNKERNKGSGTPADADQHPPHLAMRRAPCKARSPFGVPPRLSPKGIIPSQRLGFRPGFLGRGLNGRYPSSPVPVQGSTSHPGRNAGRHDAQAARERTANPPASTAPAPPHGMPPVGVPW
jgi:hypothetical protein